MIPNTGGHMKPAKEIEVTAKRVEKAAPQGDGRSIYLLISLDTPPSGSPIILNFFNNLGDIPFLQRTARPEGPNWEPGQIYFVDKTGLPLDYFYDYDAVLYIKVGDGMPL